MQHYCSICINKIPADLYFSLQRTVLWKHRPIAAGLASVVTVPIALKLAWKHRPATMKNYEKRSASIPLPCCWYYHGRILIFLTLFDILHSSNPYLRSYLRSFLGLPKSSSHEKLDGHSLPRKKDILWVLYLFTYIPNPMDVFCFNKWIPTPQASAPTEGV